MARAVGYARISKDENGSLSTETQEQAIREWCERNGHELIALYRDIGVSGGVKPMDRPEARKAIKRARSRQADLLVVSKLDMISRAVADTLEIVYKVLAKRASLVSIAENCDFSTPEGRAFLSMAGTFAELERNRIRARTREALATRRRKGLKTGGSVPFGYRATKDKRLVPVAHEQRTLDRAFKLRAQGTSWRETAETLTRERRFRRGGRRWNPPKVCNVLTAERRRREAVRSRRH